MPSADRLVAIFTEAKARPPGPERAQFLAEACGADADLKEQVVSLLEADAEEGRADFLKSAIARPITPVTEKPGGRIGQYKLLQQLGEGGCGVVYMAEQQEPVRRRVALKIIKLGMDTKQVVARFEAERQALALMDHPNIARVLDAGATETGRPFFVMELVRGIKITDYCDQNNLSATERLELFIQVCQAVQHAHQKGVIHRDIKPSNILVAQHDSVAVPKVIDFGIAKATAGQQLTDKTVFTAFEQFIGTPAYMSPEQAQLSGLDIDTRTDIYALGVLLYELLTGRTPFDQMELLAAGLDEMRRTIREREPPMPSTCLSTLVAAELTSTAIHRQTEPPKLIHLVRGDLDWIVMKALEKDRTRRYETANGLAMDVQRHLRNEPVIARPPSNLYRLQKLIQRNRLSFAAAGAVTMTAMLALVILVSSNMRITRESKAKVAALNSAQANERQAKEQLFLSLKNQAQARRYSRQMGQRLDSLAAVSEAARIRSDPSLRDHAIAAMALSDVRRGPKWQVSQTNCIALACDSRYRRYAVLDHQSGLTVRSLADGDEVQRLEIPATNAVFTVLSFSPDGRFLAKVQQGQPAQVWLLDTGESILQGEVKSFRGPTFSSDSRLIALPEGDSVRCFDLATGTEQKRWKTDGTIHSLQFSPRGRRIAVGYLNQPWVSIYDTIDGREVTQLPIGANRFATVCWHSEGNRLAVGGSQTQIQIWDVEARRNLTSLEGHVQEVDQLTFHPDGMLLASGSWDGTVRLWDLATGRQQMQIPLSAQLQFSKDGQWLGLFWSDAEHAQLLEVIPTQEYFTLENNPSWEHLGYNFCAPSPDNRLLAAAMRDGAGIWDLQRRRAVAFLPSGYTTSVAFEPDGQALLTCSEQTGLLRWPIQLSGTNTFDLVIGPPQRLETPFAPKRLAWNHDLKTLAIVSKRGERGDLAAVLHPEAESAPRLTMRHPGVGYVALSPDAEWLATSGWHSDRVRLWNAGSGELVWDRLVGAPTRVSFTPDSRQLIIARGSEFSFLDVGTLEIIRRLPREVGLYPGDAVFSPDGRLMALEMAPGLIHLKEVSTYRTVAQLHDPFEYRSMWMTFGADGTKLVAISSAATAVHVWDLRAIRVRLKTMGLDWDWPEFPASSKPEESRTSLARGPLKIQVIGGDAR
jgi:serine/threonine protein kinase/WD40 repeat protein